MLIALIVVAFVLVVFVGVGLLLTHRKFEFDIEGGKLLVKNSGSHLKIYFNEKLVKDVFAPQLYAGEKVEFLLQEKQFHLVCKCNYFATKMRVEIFEGEKLVADNGVKFK